MTQMTSAITNEMLMALNTAPIDELYGMHTDPGWQNIVPAEERRRVLEATLPTDFGPCPAWCRRGAGAPSWREDLDVETGTRVHDHAADFGPFRVSQVTRLGRDGVVTSESPMLLAMDVDDEMSDIAEARQLAVHLTRAVRLLGELVEGPVVPLARSRA